ncbi:glycoside hydrolase family 11 protein [Ruminococcus flavefaciens]|uniref:glycoside hydrolase family 11 protein n=1 Tax=Ruminococcus flavefaciens TaxID=1265 RepID=UPI0026EF9EDB|nr:glycoside hydrolase family 11 protein [Ruminococcus flavefaciens]MDD7516750.1 glycoside hydrolase family 11 protein [Ruminococcus flavefaciens]MDY5691955.1 glycoside hydrolase family 11 protein [Ruminococcus flavefaciens]
MKLTKLKKIIGGTVSAMMIAASIPTVASAADQQTRGNIGGYDYEMWNQNGQGQASMNPGAGSFTCSWSNIENFLARMGKNYDSQKKNYKAFGNIVLTYDVEYTPRGNSYMCVYGWTRNPLMEYYIVEGWGDWRPPGNDGENKGTVTLNGNTYDIRKTMRYNQPSLDGTATFPQYWSVRKTSGSANNQTNYMKGTIDVSKHFDAWAQSGLDMSGTLYEVSLNIEGYRSNGSANVKSVTVSQGGSDSGQQQNNNNNQQNNNNNQNQGWDWNNQGNQNQNNQWDWNNQWNNNNNNQWNGANNWDWNNQNNWNNNQNQNNQWDWNNQNNWNNNQNQNNQWDWNNQNNWNNQNQNNQWDWNNQWNNNNNNQWNGANNWDWNNQNNWDNQGNQNQGWDWNNQNNWNNNQNQNNQWDWNNQNNWNNNQNQNNQWDWNNNNNNQWNNNNNNQWNGANNWDWNNQNNWNNQGNQNNGQQQGNTQNLSGKKLVAISFDDGASAQSRQDPAYRIMDALIKNNMTATFFYVSDWIKTNEQVKFAYQNGMEVANHTKSHQSLGSLGSQQIRSEWEQCNSKLKSIIGTEPSHLMRLPYLDGGGQVKSALYDVPLISCGLDTQDWNGASKDQIVNTIKQAAQNGSLEGKIVLCHENYATTAAAMEEVLPWLAQNGYQNVTVSEMFAARGKSLQGGQIYTQA